ncbi:MAG: helicase-exonuclease AddAB subunit AddA, partial [Lachnospiraceae bacterium]|nr:helicase-exonuclease AddAB subunit AddA [Lachnospiraceae bacterium]
MEFSKEQVQAIESRNENLLVSAAAGSGKTTVLVERIIRKVLDSGHPVDIDRILVMTFTKAAADQMRDKILKAIYDKMSIDPTDRHLARQSTLVHNAQIGTIHSFCLNVIRNHFQEIGLDPDFRVADEGECKLLRQEVLSKVLEQSYEAASDEFIYMTECLAAGKSDSSLEDIIDSLYDFSMSHPEPDEWLEKCIDTYSGNEDTDKENEPAWVSELIANAGLLVSESIAQEERALSLCNSPDGPYMYASGIASDIESLNTLNGCKTYEEYRSALAKVNFVKLGSASKNGPYVDDVLKERAKEVRDIVKKSITDLAKEDFGISLEHQRERIKACEGVVRELVRLTREYTRSYADAKRDKKVVDFSDLEHMCISILASDDGHTAREYREYFDEIYVDEYQDSSLVQEELLKYISRGNNLFMVGDVKQSIYSFRLARPQLFIDKLGSYIKKDDDGTGSGDDVADRRIDLSENYRSRSGVIDSVNELFSCIMNGSMGGIVYDDAAALHAKAKYPPVSEGLQKTELILADTVRGMNQREHEAKMIAARIKELMKEQLVFDPTQEDPDRMRPIRYSDIVILLRTASGWDEKFKKTISDEGIPVHIMSRTGYFTAPEVSILLDYLTVLDNPLQDIPMAAVLLSTFGCMDNSEMAMLKTYFSSGFLYDALRCISEEEGRDDEAFNVLRDKAVRFLKSYEEMRAMVHYTDVYNILLKIIDGQYGSYVKALPDGKRKSANLDMLLKKAEDYGKLSYKGLFHFVRYIEMLKKHDIDYGEANTIEENDDAVKIMTIHKSKGLEFPVCFVAGVSKGYNSMDASASVIPDSDLGFGIALVDPEKRIKQETGIRRAASKKKYYEILSEEARVLYVAMTRAKE